MAPKVITLMTALALLSACAQTLSQRDDTRHTTKAREQNFVLAEPASVRTAYAPSAPMADYRPADRERYGAISDNPVKEVSKEPISSFSADVDTGSYANVRRFLMAGQLPPVDAVRVEELINYFPLEAKLSAQRPHPLALASEVIDSPWLQDAKLLRIVIEAQEHKPEALPPANLVFLVDVSGSMASNDKLPLVQQTLRLLTQQLRPQDRVTLISYASGTQVVLPSTAGSNKTAILAAINQLHAGGSTAGADAMALAYQQAKQHYHNQGINRILMMTDGDFNVGTIDFATLKGRVAEQRKSGVSLSTLGFGTGNYNEHLMEQMADAGDGNYSYIDNEKEARKVLQQQLSSTLATVASDVKIQVEFNPAQVSQYRLIGYENRLLRQEDFNNDHKDAGDVGAGHVVTALYEFVPQGKAGWLSPSRYQNQPNTNATTTTGKHDEYAVIHVRYKPVGKINSQLISHPVPLASIPLQQASIDGRFAVAVATYGQLLRGGDKVGNRNWHDVKQWATQAKGRDPYGLRQELIELVDRAANLGAAKTPNKTVAMNP